MLCECESKNGKITPREIQILRLAATGATNREIGLRLGITENTVKNCAGSIYRKLGVVSRVEAVLEAIRRGYVVVDGIAPIDSGQSEGHSY